jgi:hypothetical protein
MGYDYALLQGVLLALLLQACQLLNCYPACAFLAYPAHRDLPFLHPPPTLPPSCRYMSINTALQQLLEIESSRQGGAYGPDTLAVGMSRLGAPDQQIIAGSMQQLLEVDFGPPLHCLVIAGGYCTCAGGGTVSVQERGNCTCAGGGAIELAAVLRVSTALLGFD